MLYPPSDGRIKNVPVMVTVPKYKVVTQLSIMIAENTNLFVKQNFLDRTSSTEYRGIIIMKFALSSIIQAKTDPEIIELILVSLPILTRQQLIVNKIIKGTVKQFSTIRCILKIRYGCSPTTMAPNTQTFSLAPSIRSKKYEIKMVITYIKA